jgi:hypothetical protein
MIRVATALILLALSACSGHELACCEGPVFALNPGNWQPSADDLKAPESGK